MMLVKIEKPISLIESMSISLKGWVFSFGAIISTRLLIEYLAFPGLDRTLYSILGAILHTTTFFLVSFLLLLVVTHFLTQEKVGRVARIFLWGQWIILIPPIIDKLIFKDKYFFSFYVFDSFGGLASRFFHFFGPNPDFGITYGTRVEVFLVVFLLGGYVFLKTRKISRMLISFFVFYLTLFILGSLPSLLAFVLGPFLTEDPVVRASTVAKIFLSPLSVFSRSANDLSASLHLKMSLVYNLVLFFELIMLIFLYSKEKFLAILKNLRLPQVIFNFGLFFIGLGLAWHYFPGKMSFGFFSILMVANLCLAIFCAWLYSVFINDISDVAIDQITNTDRPLIRNVFTVKEYEEFSFVFLALSLLSSLAVGIGFFVLIAAYHLLTYVYSCFPFRLKRFVLISTIIASFASMINLFMGYLLVSGQNQLQFFPWRVGLLLFLAYSLILPLKDLKDYEGDRANGAYTLVVLLGPRNARLVLATLVFAFYVLSVFVVNEKGLFLFALLFGGLNYYLIGNEKIKPLRLNWYVLVTVFFYGLIMTKQLFF